MYLLGNAVTQLEHHVVAQAEVRMWRDAMNDVISSRAAGTKMRGA